MKKYTTETFIASAAAKHNSKYDYSKVSYNLAHDFINIGCPIHGWFRQRAYSHLSYGCKQCGDQKGTIKRTTKLEDFINRANQKHDYKFDYTHVSLRSQHELIDIVCPVHGIFKQAATDHLKGRGCNQCGIKRRTETRRGCSTHEFVQKAIAVHGDTFDYSKTEYSSNKRLKIICRVHGEFYQLAASHLAGNGCLVCKPHNKGRNPISFNQFEQRAREIHGDRYDYQYYSKLSDKVGIICPDHGLFMQTGTDHIFSGAGCPCCRNVLMREQLRYTQNEFETMLAEKWEDRITLVGNYQDLSTLTSFSCFAHGKFTNTPERILHNKHGCKHCWEAMRGISMRLSQNEFEQRASIVHHDKYRYGTFIDTDTKIEIECPLHGKFLQNSGNHLAGNGCPSCSIRKTDSQNRWLDKLGVPDIPTKTREVWFTLEGKRIKADGYNPDTNTIYEFWGDFWHGNPRIYNSSDINNAVGKTFGELYEKTLEKRRLITNHGYNLIEIWETDWKRINGK